MLNPEIRRLWNDLPTIEWQQPYDEDVWIVDLTDRRYVIRRTANGTSLDVTRRSAGGLADGLTSDTARVVTTCGGTDVLDAITAARMHLAAFPVKAVA